MDVNSLGQRVASIETTQAHHSTKLNEIHRDVKSLLASRSYTRGAWKAVLVAAGAVSAVVSLIVAYLTGVPRP